MEKTTEQKENKMGIMPIPELLIKMSLPMIISMLVQAMYNIVDSIFVAQLGEDALAAVSLAFPIQNLMIAVGAGTGVGINTMLSRSLGEKKFKEVNQAANNGVFLSLISYLIFALFGIFGTKQFFAGQTDTQVILDYGIQYLFICTTFSIGIFMQLTMERLLQSTGKTFYSMITQGTGAIINIILDPILIFGLFGFPRLEVAGAALATVIGQIVAAIMGVIFNVLKNNEIQFQVKGFRPSKRAIIQIYSVGIPAIIMQAIGSVMVFALNKILLIFSSTAVSVFGVYFKLQSFVFMPIFGLNNGMVPILAYNYGAAHKKRILDTIKLSASIAIGIMLLGLVIFQLIPEKLLLLFKASDNMLQIGIPALRIISLSFVFAGFCIIILSVFQAFGEGILSLVVSATRQLIFIIPIAYLFANFIGLSVVWWAFPIAEFASVLLSIIFFRHLYQKKIKNIGEKLA